MISAAIALSLLVPVLAHGAAASARPRNVILIGIDTLRADRLGCYGYARPTSPFLDQLASEGAVFEQAISQASWTLPSFASLFTSQHTNVHGVTDPDKRLRDDAVTLARTLRDKGYKTAAFATGPFFNPKYKLDLGFDTYAVGYDLMLAQQLPAAFSWLDEHERKPFFLFLHSLDAHAPYGPPAPFKHAFDKDYRGMVDRLILDVYFLFVYNSQWTSDWGPPPSKAYSLLVDEIRKNPADREHIAAHYDEGVAAADGALGTLWAELKRRGLYDDTLIILTADHGEELGEQGAFRHNFCLRDSVSRVPLVVRFPGSGAGGRRIKPQVQLIDVAPTILDLLNIPVPSAFTGVSLASLLKGGDGEPSPYAFSSSDTPQGRNSLFSIRSARWKLLRYVNPPRQLLFDLTNDPGETANVAPAHPDVTGDLSARLDRWLAAPKAPETPGVTLDEQELRRLRSMGYLR